MLKAHQKIPDKNEYYFEFNIGFKTILKSLTGAHIIYIAENSIDTESFSGLLQIYKLLLVKESSLLEDLDLQDYEKVMTEIFNKTLNKYFITPPILLEIIFIISGRKFETNWKEWLNSPVEELLALLDVAKRLGNNSFG